MLEFLNKKIDIIGLSGEAIRFDKGGSILLAPNGKKSNLTPEQYKLVRTPAFKKWFGDWENDPKNASKVVDENGEPHILYHGTTRDFSEFLAPSAFSKAKPRTIGGKSFAKKWIFFFSSSPEIASDFAEDITKAKKGGSNVMPVFLNLRNILTIDAKGKLWDNYTDVILDEYKKGEYNGVIVKNVEDNFIKIGIKSDVYVAFDKDPNDIKIKSIFNTTFDSKNPDIRYGKGGEIKMFLAYHTADEPLTKIKDTPLWFTKTLKNAKGYHNINKGSYTYQVEISGNILSERNLKKMIGEDEYQDLITTLTANPSGKQIKDAIAPFIRAGYDGIQHWDYDPNDFNKDTTSILIFEPSKNVRAVRRINPGNRNERYRKGGILSNFKPSVEFDKKFGTHISYEGWKFPDGLTADEVHKKYFYPIVKVRITYPVNEELEQKLEAEIEKYANKLTDEHFPGIAKSSDRWSILHGMVSGFNYDDIHHFAILGKFGMHKSSDRSRDELLKMGFSENDLQWVISQKTADKIKSQLLFGKKKMQEGGEITTPDEQLITVEPSVLSIMEELGKRGHLALIIGGAVRDALLGIEPKDIDVEVYKISYTDLANFLAKFGKVDLVGKTFGVIKFHPRDSDMTYDFSVPRKENKIGIGHTSFAVTFDKNMTIADAGARRDFTFNAIAYDPIENKIYDYFGGLKDLGNKVIRHTSKAFSEDPLRILRAMQFQARFDFTIHPDTIALIREMLKTSDFNDLSKERIHEEWMKWAAKGIRHDLIFKFLRDTTLIDYYPELKLLKETPQDKIYHPEGDVEIHTEMTLREMDKLIERDKISGEEKAILVMSILLHDIAKPQCTKEEMKRGRLTITSAGHESKGGYMCHDFLPRLGFPESFYVPVANLVANHLAGVSISAITSRSGKLKAVKKLSRRLSPATIHQLIYVMDADNYGRGTERKEATGKADLLELAAEANVKDKAYQPILMGRHLIELGMKPSPMFREILAKGFEAQENGEFNDIEGGKVWLNDYLKNTVDKF